MYEAISSIQRASHFFSEFGVTLAFETRTDSLSQSDSVKHNLLQSKHGMNLVSRLLNCFDSRAEQQVPGVPKKNTYHGAKDHGALNRFDISCQEFLSVNPVPGVKMIRD